MAALASMATTVVLAVGCQAGFSHALQMDQMYLTGTVLLVGALTAATAWWAVGATLRPVESIRSRLADIACTDLSLRVPTPAEQEEIARLADTTNAFLDRLERSIAQQRQFASDAAHELRTPLSALRLRIEEALLYPGETSPEEALRGTLASAARLESVITDLLLLARLGTCDPIVEHDVDLTALVYTEIARRSAVPIHTQLEEGVIVRGAKPHLSRLLNNLLDNAERHAHARVEVRLHQHEGHTVLTVSDDGAGIPPEHHQRVFDRFVRLDSARSRADGGAGLGLSIARDIALTHNGTLEVEHCSNGARFVFRLPPPVGAPIALPPGPAGR
jgi:signal transduction histidine kinase